MPVNPAEAISNINGGSIVLSPLFFTHILSSDIKETVQKEWIEMCRVIDVAAYAISRAIDYRNAYSDDRYYMDFYKLNKLLYLAQGTMLARFNTTIFSEDIYAYTCGPYIRELEFIFAKWGYELIDENYSQDLSLPSSCSELLDEIILNFGRCNRQQLGIATKTQTPWLKTYCEHEDPKVIDIQIIKEYFLGLQNSGRGLVISNE